VESREYVAAYVTDPAGQHLPLTLDITSSEPVRRDLTLTRAVSTIDGTVANKNDSPEVGAFVLLMPKDFSERWAYRVDQTDSDGSFGLSSIPSGDYLLVALSDGSEVEYRDPKVAAALAQLGKPMHIEPGDRLNIKLNLLNSSSPIQ
jgi:hypothetical protein